MIQGPKSEVLPCNHIEKHRAKLLRQKSLLETTDFGSGSSSAPYKTRFRQVKEIARHSSVNQKMGRLLYRLTVFTAPDDILEIGTAMGISTMYMACAAPSSRLVSIEGCAVIAQKALDGFRSLEINNVELVQGNFDKWLPKTLAGFEKLDLVFIDGNHKEKPTISYFKILLPKLHANSMVVIDDIHWSKGMEKAWKEIIAHEEVSISIDLFRTGILLFRKDIEKQNFTLRF